MSLNREAFSESEFRMKEGNAAEERISSGKPPTPIGYAGRKAKMFTEQPVRLFVNSRPHAVFMCTPQQLKELAVGHLLTTGTIRSTVEILSSETRNHSCGYEVHMQVHPLPEYAATPEPRPAFPDNGVPGLGILPTAGRAGDAELFTLRRIELAAAEMVRNAELYQRTGGVHCAASGNQKHLFCREDAGRSNALDKAVGTALLKGMDLSRSFLIVTGRIAFDMLLKAATANIPVLGSLNIPSDLAVETAGKMGITVIGKLLKKEQSVYTHHQRIG